MNEKKIERIGKVATESFNDVNTYKELIDGIGDEYAITDIRAGLVINICYAYMVNDDKKIRDYLKRKLDRLLKNEDN